MAENSEVSDKRTEHDISLRNQISELLQDMVTQVIQKTYNKETDKETILKRTGHSNIFDPFWEDRATNLANELNKLITLEQKQERSVSDDARCIRMYNNLPKLIRDGHSLLEGAIKSLPLHPEYPQVISVSNNSWKCNICDMSSNSCRFDRIIRHLATTVHFNAIKALHDSREK